MFQTRSPLELLTRFPSALCCVAQTKCGLALELVNHVFDDELAVLPLSARAPPEGLEVDRVDHFLAVVRPSVVDTGSWYQKKAGPSNFRFAYQNYAMSSSAQPWVSSLNE